MYALSPDMLEELALRPASFALSAASRRLFGLIVT
jgi:hypothetical protein